MLKTISLQLKMMVLVTIVVLVAVSSLVAYDAYFLQTSLRQSNLHHFEYLTSSIGVRVEKAVADGEIQSALDQIQRAEPQLAYLTYHEKIGDHYQVVASTSRNTIGFPSSSEIVKIPGSKQMSLTYLEQKQSQLGEVRLLSPIATNSGHTGILEVVGYYPDPSMFIKERLTLTVSVGIFVSLFAIIGMGLIINRLMINPLHWLRDAVNSVLKQGTQKMEMPQEPEFAEVAVAFHEVVSKMEKHYLESITDPLTGVYNSSYFKQTLTELIEKTKTADESLVLLFCDVDDFKKINDNLGHLYGDQVLRHVSQLICRKVRPTDVVCRYGGEEFVILLPQTNPDTGKQIAEQIRQAVAELGGTESIFPVTISIGLAACPAHDDGSQLVELADQAMYTAKRQGKNKVVSAGELKLHKSRPNLDVAEEKWLMLNTVLSLAESRFYHGEVTDSHSSAVSRYACAIGSKMGMSSEEINRIRVAGLLHDIGMLAIAPSIALKQGELTRFEYELVKAHSVYGYNLLSHIKEMQDILPYVLYHHERPDGKGYPYGLTRIPLGARIISVAEAFDAMVSTAYYRRQPLTKDLAMEELKRGSGTQFDKDVVETFLSVLSRDAQTAGISI